jgi:hypothetical protein
MIQRFTRKFIQKAYKTNQTSKYFKKSAFNSQNARFFCTSEPEKIEFIKKWKLKKMEDSEAINIHEKIFKQIKFPKGESSNEFILLDQASSTRDKVDSFMFWFTITGSFLLTSLFWFTWHLSDDDKIFKEAEHNRLYKIAKIMDRVETPKQEYKPSDRLKWSLEFINAFGESTRLPEIHNKHMFRDDHEHQKIFKLIYGMLPDEIPKEEKAKILTRLDMSYDNKFFFVDIAGYMQNTVIAFTLMFLFSAWRVRPKKVRKLVLDYSGKRLTMNYSYLTRNFVVQKEFGKLAIESDVNGANIEGFQVSANELGFEDRRNLMNYLDMFEYVQDKI